MKPWYTSKTLWVAAIMMVASVLVVFFGADIEVSPDAGYVGIALSFIQVVLRFITKEPIVIDKNSQNF